MGPCATGSPLLGHMVCNCAAKKKEKLPSARPNSVPGEKKTPNPVPAKYNSFRKSGNKLIVK